MSLTDSTYFVRDVSLPAGALNTISASLTRYEPEILEHLLGYALAKLVLDYTNPGSEQRIIDLVEGKEYSEDDYTVNWGGFINSKKVSILTYYTYIQIIKDKSVTFQNVGAVASNVENGVNVGPAMLILRASAELRELAGYRGQYIYAPSLYNFLYFYQEFYPELYWNEYKPLNQFGI